MANNTRGTLHELVRAIKNFLRDRFNLDEDKAEEDMIVESIQRNIHFKGTNLWTLIFAILIASIGLNVNSTAVIIGAMLISPVMGPIMGIGLGIGILDFDLMKKGIKNLLVAAVFSIITSWLYFTLSPLHETNSEILARTTPSLWDVLIAFFGGLAGIIAGTRKEKSNVLPGVAIATALIPPLCTTGFGIATGHWYISLGAIYLFFINSLFICLATFIIVRFLNFRKKSFASDPQYHRVVRSIWMLVAVTVLPSIYLAFRIVQKAIFEQNARNFVQNEFRFTGTQVISQTYKYNSRLPVIDLLLIGQELSDQTIDSLKGRMGQYKLDSSSLIIHQGLNAKKEIDFAQVKASILEDVFSSERKMKDTIEKAEQQEVGRLPDISPDLRTLFPEVKSFSLTRSEILQPDSIQKRDTVTLFYASLTRYFSTAEREKLNLWLKERTATDSVKMLFEYDIPKKNR